MRLSAVVAVVIALAAAWPVQRSLLLAAQQGERLAVVDVTVVDRKGSPVSDLGRDEFELLVDGERRSVESVGVDDRPVLVVLLLDISSSSPIQPAELKPALAKRFWSGLGPSDRVRLDLVGASSAGPGPTYGSGRRSLQAVLHLLDLPPTYAVRDKLVPTTSTATPQIGVRERKATGARMGPSPIWDAVYAAASALEQEPGRRAIVLLTDGRATGNVHGLDDTIARALAARIAVHVVSAAEEDLIAVDASNAAWVRPGVHLTRLADATGGSYASIVDALDASHVRGPVSAEKTSDMVGGLLSRALRLAHAPYRLAFSAPTFDDSVHGLEVRVTRAGLTARGPARFIARRPTPSR